MEIRSIIEIQRAKKEWKAKYKIIAYPKHYEAMLKMLRNAPLSNEVMGKREALKELIQEEA
tara:strand:+ start:418 stop:600 length:183 start_codon:yes stop_codon:yes gene_type:complete